MLLSACIIAKDEADQLPSCLASLAQVADEIVVYDTGSTDTTMQVAAAAGAVVVAGSWPGGFAQARNAALEHCRGEWVLSIDADEELLCRDPAALRAQLENGPASLLALQVPIDNLTGVGMGSGYSHVADRLFRRRSCRWRGRLHEQLVTGSDGSFPPVQPVHHARLKHRGYLRDVEADRDKVQRNLRLAAAEVDDPSFGDRGIALVWLGRAMWAADRPEDALGPLLEGARTTTNPVSRRQGLETAARIALRLDRLDDARRITSELRAASARPVVADLIEAGASLAAGRYREALDRLDRTGMAAGPVTDDDGHGYGPHHQIEWRTAALVGLDRADEAADLLLDAYRQHGRLDCELDLLVEALDRAARPLDDFAALVPAAALPGVVAATLRLDPERSHRLLQALWRAASTGEGDGAVTVLAGASLLGRVLEPDLAAGWSALLRDRGLGDLCPLRALVSDRSAPPARRLAAAQVLAEGFGEDPPSADLVAALAALAAPGRGERRDFDSLVAAWPAAWPAAWAGAWSAAGEGARPQVRWAQEAGEAPEFSVVLLAAGGAELVLGALQALAAALPEDRTFEVVAVDAGSCDATAVVLGSLAGDVAVVRTDLDVGRARAGNLGLSTARGRTVIIMDSTARPAPGWVEPLLAALDADPSLAAVGPALVDGEGRVLSAGAQVRFGRPDPPPAAGLARRPWRDEPVGPVFDRIGVDTLATVDALDPPVVAVRREAVAGIGGFDEGYWGGGETVDLCFSLRAAGLGVACQPASRVGVVTPSALPVEPWSATDPQRVAVDQGAGASWQLVDNRRRFLQRWGPAPSVPSPALAVPGRAGAGAGPGREVHLPPEWE